MKALHVNQSAGHGGASGICLALHNALLARGQESAVLVGRRARELPGVNLIEQEYHSIWACFCMALARRVSLYSGRIRGAGGLTFDWLPRLASPERLCSWCAGHEEFHFPATRRLLDQAPFRPDVLHLHNLHGNYFDLRELPRLSSTLPTIITLHDAWLLSGHCAHSFNCQRWKTGCGSCPGLNIYPPVRRDGTAFNWRRKREIYQHSRLSLVCPSRWLAGKVRQSTLMPGATALKVIPHGVDTSIFKSGDKAAARVALGWPQDEFIVMFAADAGRRNAWKDYPTMREAIRLAAHSAAGKSIRFFAVGETAPPEQAGAARIEFLSYRRSMAECYQAADVYLHAARAEMWGLVITEAMACGTPVVATSVGGIPEQILDGRTGFLSPAGDAGSLASHLLRFIREPQLVRHMGEAAATNAQNRFSLTRMVNDYIALYGEIARGDSNVKPALPDVR